jgi:hypothetical protein
LRICLLFLFLVVRKYQIFNALKFNTTVVKLKLEGKLESVNTIIFGTKVKLIGQVPGVQQHILGHHLGSDPSAGA